MLQDKSSGAFRSVKEPKKLQWFQKYLLELLPDSVCVSLSELPLKETSFSYFTNPFSTWKKVVCGISSLCIF